MASTRDFEQAERAILDVQRRSEGNAYCADCGLRDPEYVNLTVGTFICKYCADVHRNISNRRIKDIYGRDLTEADVRRMADVGNDKANRRFLATWDPNEFPEPNTEDKERLENFIWLKYEGSWKKSAPPPQPREEPRYERPGERGGYGREHDLFRQPDPRNGGPQSGASNPAPPPQRSVWAERLGFERSSSASHPSSSRREPQPPIRDDYRFPQHEQHHNRFAHEESRAGNGNRFAHEAPPPYSTSRGRDRFRPPVAPAPSYVGQRPSQQPRYREEYDEDYDRRRDSGHHRPEKKKSSTRKKKNSNRYESDDSAYRSGNGNLTSEDSSERGRDRRRKSKRRDKYAETSEEETEEDYEEYTRKKDKKGKKSSERKKKSSKKKSGRREVSSEEESEDDDTNSIPSTNLGESGGRKAAKSPKAEFDLMSDWMGSNNDVVHASPVPPSASVPPPAQPPAPQQVHMQQMPMAPMSMYGGMMTANPAAAYVTGMPYYGMPAAAYVTGMPMSGMPAAMGMPAMVTQMQPGLVNGMVNMAIAPSQPSQHPGVPQMQQAAPPPPPPQHQMHQPGAPIPPPPQGPPPS